MPGIMAATLVVFLSVLGAEESPGDLRFTEFLESFRGEQNFPALAAAVVVDGELRWVGAVGFRKSGADVRVAEDDAFHLGSCTKAMTATLIGQLVEEGALKWDSTVAEVFPEWVEEMQPQYRQATVDHLLAHRSGLPERCWPRGGSLEDVRRLPGSPLEQRAAYCRLMLRETPEAGLGAKFIYSNTNYSLLGAMAERATGTEWETLMRRRIFAPLAMTTAGFGPMGSPGKIDQPWQHVVRGKIRIPIPPIPENDNPAPLAPGGKVHCSMRDWARFAAIHLNAPAQDHPLLRADTLEHLHTPRFGGDYAGGWGVVPRDWAGGAALTHSGSNTQNYCVAWLAPAKRLAVLIATNQADDGETTRKACDALAGKLIAEWSSPPRKDER